MTGIASRIQTVARRSAMRGFAAAPDQLLAPRQHDGWSALYRIAPRSRPRRGPAHPGPGLTFQRSVDAAFDSALGPRPTGHRLEASKAAAANDDLAALADSAAWSTTSSTERRRPRGAADQRAPPRGGQGERLRHPHRALRRPPRRPLPHRRRPARHARRRPQRCTPRSSQPHQDHGQARHRREAPAAGRPHHAARRRPRDRPPRLDHPAALRRERRACACSTTRGLRSTSTSSASTPRRPARRSSS